MNKIEFVKYKLALQDLHMSDLAYKLKIHPTTLARKLRENRNIDRADEEVIFELCKFTQKEIKEWNKS